MKKRLFLFLTAAILTSLLASCQLPQGDDASKDCHHEFSDANDTTCNLCGKEFSIYVPPSEPPTDENKDEISNSETQNSTWQFSYDYGLHLEGIATLLVGYSRLAGGFENVVIPKDIVAGDTISIDHTGEIYIDEMYPGAMHLYNGEIKSYSFSRAHVIHLSGESEFSIERIKNVYDYKDAYVILDRSGKFVPLDEYTGDEIYLVTDQKRYTDNGYSEGVPDVKYPIACMLAYNPRDLEDGVPQKTTAELRNEKVVFELDMHLLWNELEKPIYKEDETKFDAGFIIKNDVGNEFIAYAPNAYSYYVLAEHKNAKYDIADVFNRIEYKYFEGFSSYHDPSVNVDYIAVSDTQIMFIFPDFDTYFLCQEELLNDLCSINSVESVKVGYLNQQNGTKEIRGAYRVYADLGYHFEYQNLAFTTYEEYFNAFGKFFESNTGLTEITEETFIDNYVFIVFNSHYREVDITDARLVGDTVYFTNNCYVTKGELHDAMEYLNSCVIVVPKSELGEISSDVEIKTIHTLIFVDC